MIDVILKICLVGIVLSGTIVFLDWLYWLIFVKEHNWPRISNEVSGCEYRIYKSDRGYSIEYYEFPYWFSLKEGHFSGSGHWFYHTARFETKEEAIDALKKRVKTNKERKERSREEGKIREEGRL